MVQLLPSTLEERLAQVEAQVRSLLAGDWTERASARTPTGEYVGLDTIATAPAAAEAAQTTATDAAGIAAAAQERADAAVLDAEAARLAAEAAEQTAGAVSGQVLAAQTAADDAATSAQEALAAAQQAAETGGNAQQQADLAASAAAAAQQAADEAGTAAAQADADAAAAAAVAAQAVADAAAARTVADSKITTYRQGTAPTGTIPVGSLWNDTANQERQSRWSGTAWVLVRDLAIGVAQNRADASYTLANGRNRVFPQATAPTAAGSTLVVGDLWIDTANGRRLSTWSGTAWVLQAFGVQVFGAQLINAGDLLATGTVAAALLAADSINGKTITGATIRTAASGQRIQIDSTNGLVGYNSAGVAMTSINPATGLLTATGANITGTIQTAADGPRVRLRQVDNGAYGYGTIEFLGEGGGAVPSVTATTVGVTGGSSLSINDGNLGFITMEYRHDYLPEGGSVDTDHLRLRFDEMEMPANAKSLSGKRFWATGSAVLSGGWGGVIRWARFGNLVVVQVGLNRAGAALAMNAWTSTIAGVNLPPALGYTASSSVALDVPATNMQDWGPLQMNIDGSGRLQLVARWQARTIGTGSWIEGSGTYLTTPDVFSS